VGCAALVRNAADEIRNTICLQIIGVNKLNQIVVNNSKLIHFAVLVNAVSGRTRPADRLC
jgi:hypothetical protein